VIVCIADRSVRITWRVSRVTGHAGRRRRIVFAWPDQVGGLGVECDALTVQGDRAAIALLFGCSPGQPTSKDENLTILTREPILLDGFAVLVVSRSGHGYSARLGRHVVAP
jgi:hypothetical protein